MGHIYINFRDMEFDFPAFYSGNPCDIKLFIKSQDSERRLKSCFAVKKLLEGIFEEDKTLGEIKGYEVSVIDLAKKEDTEFIRGFGQTWTRMENKGNDLFVPIFHNAGRFVHLPQLAWDCHVPGIFSLTHKEYIDVTNTSKRDCYDVLLVD